MAVNSFDEILNNLVSDSEDREVLESLSNKYPEIKNGWLRQSDYSRKLDSFRDTEKKVEAWNKWAEENWDADNNAPKMEVYWRNKAQELESQAGTDMTFDEIKNFTEGFLTERGVMTKTDLESAINSKAQEIDKGFQGSAYFSAVIAEKTAEHLSEFGKPLKVREFISKLGEYGTNDLDSAYERYVAEDRKSREEKQMEEKIERIRTEEREKAKQEVLAQLPNSGGLPIDQGEPSTGHFEARVRSVGQPDAAEKANLGDGTLAQIAAQAYRKQQLGITE
jgi:hypothetical protein